MANRDLHDVLLIKAMAAHLASTELAGEQGEEIAAAYERIRQKAKALHDRSWPGDAQAFDFEVPPLAVNGASYRLPRGMQGHQALFDRRARGERAIVLAGQLAAWAEGHQEAFEIEVRLEAEAKARATEKSGKSQVGFG
jgi:hypothetical protein